MDAIMQYLKTNTNRRFATEPTKKDVYRPLDRAIEYTGIGMDTPETALSALRSNRFYYGELARPFLPPEIRDAAKATLVLIRNDTEWLVNEY